MHVVNVSEISDQITVVTFTSFLEVIPAEQIRALLVWYNWL